MGIMIKGGGRVKNHYWIRLALTVGVIGVIFYIVHIRWAISAEDIRTYILSYGWLSPFIFFVLYTLGPLIFFPSSLLSITAGLTYGVWPGVLYIWLGANGAAVTGYVIGRFFGGSVLKVHDFKKVKLLQGKIYENGFFYVLILRLIPLVGFDLLCYISGMAKVRFSHYMLATMVGIIPGVLAYTLVGTGLTSGNLLYTIAAFLPITLLVGLTIIYRSRVKRWLGINGKDR